MLKHKHLLVRAEVLDPPKDLKSTKLWLKKLIKVQNEYKTSKKN